MYVAHCLFWLLVFLQLSCLTSLYILEINLSLNFGLEIVSPILWAVFSLC